MKKIKDIPKGPYCAGYNGMCCPYWSLKNDKPYQMNGYCKLVNIGDWEDDTSELWDQVKICGINEMYEKE